MSPKINIEASLRRSNAEAAAIKSLPQLLICEKKAAHMYGMSVHWFRRKRFEGGGPKFTKLGRSVRYSVRDLAEYFESPPN